MKKTRVEKKKKHRSIILQRIRMRGSMKKKGKKKRRKKHRTVTIAPAKTVNIPRKFRRHNNRSIDTFVAKTDDQQLRMNLINRHMPPILKYLITQENSPFNIQAIKKEKKDISNVEIIIPKHFSIIENSEESILTIKTLIYSCLFLSNRIVFNYKDCEYIDLSTQVLFDIILKDYWHFANLAKKANRNNREYFTLSISGININNENIQKFLFSVGSPAILGIKTIKFPDIVKYPLCVHDNEKEKNPIKRMEQKEFDTSDMADYVIESLNRMNKTLTCEKREDLCTVIGEILINAEEHSTTKYRFSIGYFKEEKKDNEHYGVFRLVILNFGKTIYEKFKSKDCPNKDIVSRMEQLSKNYTKRNFFRQRKFEEETLWTLYALQEGVTSISTDVSKRGNGSIRFIDSFFNIKGTEDADSISKMTIASGKSRIVFDGTYGIKTKKNTDGNVYKVMTFNDSGNIEDKPNNKYVFNDDLYFPGTMISAKILLSEDDVKPLNK